MKATLFLLFPLFFVGKTFAQTDDPKQIWWKKSERISDSLSKKSILYYYFYEPQREAFFNKNKDFVNKKLTVWNYKKYLKVAFCFAQIGEEKAAEKMLTNLVDFAQARKATAYKLIAEDTISSKKISKNFGKEHHICLFLSQIFAHKNDFENALKYVILADKKYPFNDFHCGNAAIEYNNTLKKLYEQVYNGLNMNTKTTQSLINQFPINQH